MKSRSMFCDGLFNLMNIIQNVRVPVCCFKLSSISGNVRCKPLLGINSSLKDEKLRFDAAFYYWNHHSPLNCCRNSQLVVG